MHLDSDAARLEMNAKGYRYDATLDPIADLIEQGPAAWSHLPPRAVDLGAIHKDFRDHYRRAVAAGAIPDDRGPTAAGAHQPRSETP